MKKMLIGAVLFLGGMLSMIGSLLCTAIALPSFSSWSNEYPSRLFSVLFEGRPPIYEDGFGGAEGVGLGFLFEFGILLLCVGLVVLILQYFTKEKTSNKADLSDLIAILPYREKIILSKSILALFSLDLFLRLFGKR